MLHGAAAGAVVLPFLDQMTVRPSSPTTFEIAWATDAGGRADEGAAAEEQVAEPAGMAETVPAEAPPEEAAPPSPPAPLETAATPEASAMPAAAPEPMPEPAAPVEPIAVPEPTPESATEATPFAWASASLNAGRAAGSRALSECRTTGAGWVAPAEKPPSSSALEALADSTVDDELDEPMSKVGVKLSAKTESTASTPPDSRA